jgi:guanylate kinase
VCAGEVEGVHYNFKSMDDMKAAIERGEFVEYAKVHNNIYGTR